MTRTARVIGSLPVGLYLYLDDQARVDEPGHDDHGGGGAYGVEQLLVGAADVVHVPGVRDVHPGADDVLTAESHLLQRRERDVEGGDRLLVREPPAIWPFTTEVQPATRTRPLGSSTARE